MSLIEKLPDLNAVKGGFGERLAAYYSKTVFSDAYVLHDVLIDGKDEHKSQIDLIIIAASGIYVVEVKTFSDAKIYGDGRKRDWQYYLGGHRYDFYNPIMQNAGHIKALQEQSEQFAHLPIFNVVLFAGNCTLKNVNYWADNTFVGYTSNISYVLKKMNEFRLAQYTDKREVVRMLRKAVENGNNPNIVISHMASVQRKAIGQPQPTISWRPHFCRINWRRLIRY